MRYILMAFIHLYWIVPKNKRQQCIFKESCSRHVYRTAKENGLIKAVNAIRERKRQCRPGYYRVTDTWVRLADNSMISISLLNERV